MRIADTNLKCVSVLAGCREKSIKNCRSEYTVQKCFATLLRNLTGVFNSDCVFGQNKYFPIFQYFTKVLTCVLKRIICMRMKLLKISPTIFKWVKTV